MLNPFTISMILGAAQAGTGLYQGHQAKKQQERALDEIRAGKQAALSQIPAIRKAWTKEAQVGAAQKAGMATNLMSSAGTLGSPGIVASRDRALQGDYMRELANLNAQLAQMRIGIETGTSSQMGQMLGSNQPNYGSITQGLGTMATPYMMDYQNQLQTQRMGYQNQLNTQQMQFFAQALGYGRQDGTGAYQAPTAYYGNSAPWEHGYPVAS